MKEIIIVLDAGGTTITAAATSTNHEIVSNLLLYPSRSKDTAEAIVNHFVNIIHSAFHDIYNGSQTCIGVSIGFPGPFDYNKGISYMKNIDKYDHIYGYPFKEALIRGLQNRPLPNQKKSLSLVFANDATMFVLGEYNRLIDNKTTRLMGITLGTGCGSTFIDAGRLVTDEMGIPADGMIYHLSYSDSIIDDYVSKRGILNIACRYGYNSNSTEIVDIYHDAVNQKSEALKVFSEFGDILLNALKKTIEAFEPAVIVIGGQIAKSYNFFGHHLNEYAKKNGIEIVISPDASKSALIGACHYFMLLNNSSQ